MHNQNADWLQTSERSGKNSETASNLTEVQQKIDQERQDVDAKVKAVSVIKANPTPKSEPIRQNPPTQGTDTGIVERGYFGSITDSFTLLNEEDL